MEIDLQLTANPSYCACADVELLKLQGVIIDAGGGPETGIQVGRA